MEQAGTGQEGEEGQRVYLPGVRLIVQLADPGELLKRFASSMGNAVFRSVVAQRSELGEQRGQSSGFEREDEMPAFFFGDVEYGFPGVERIAQKGDGQPGEIGLQFLCQLGEGFEFAVLLACPEAEARVGMGLGVLDELGGYGQDQARLRAGFKPLRGNLLEVVDDRIIVGSPLSTRLPARALRLATKALRGGNWRMETM